MPKLLEPRPQRRPRRQGRRHVRLHPKSGAQADIPALRIRATSRHTGPAQPRRLSRRPRKARASIISLAVERQWVRK